MNTEKKRIGMVDLWSTVDKTGKPIGHGVKVGNEYFNYIRQCFNVTHYTNKEIIPYISNPDKASFVQSIDHKAGKFNRIVRIYKGMREVQRNDFDIIWFYAPEIYAFFFLMFMKKKQCRIIANVFEDYSNSRLKNWIFNKAIKRVDLAIATNKELLLDQDKCIHVPDYSYDKSYYDKYRLLKKEKRVICLGTMNERKHLREAVEAFSNNGFELHIVGQFVNEEEYARLLQIKGDNVIIENRYLDEEEYYTLLGSSQYCLIPYDEEFYKNRTSGVLQECMFCDSIPVCATGVLQFTGIDGIGYKSVVDLANISFSELETENILNDNALIRENDYSEERIKGKIVAAIKQFCD